MSTEASTSPTLGWTIRSFPKLSRPRITSEFLTVVNHDRIGDRYARMVIAAPNIAERFLPGQFVMVSPALEGEKTPTLPRPMAIYDADRDAGTITIVYGIVGGGTEKLSRISVGARVMTVGPLGQPFILQEGTQHVLLIGRGIGTCSIAPLVPVARQQGIQVSVLNSARIPEALIGRDLFENHEVRSLWEVTDAEGTSSIEHVTTLLENSDISRPDQIFVCGSHRLTSLAHRLASSWSIPAQVSLEAHMACGIGYCHGCASGVVGEKEESPLVCLDGPVFNLAPNDTP